MGEGPPPLTTPNVQSDGLESCYWNTSAVHVEMSVSNFNAMNEEMVLSS